MDANDTTELTEQGNHRWLALYYPCICIRILLLTDTHGHISFLDLVCCTICVSIYGNIYIRNDFVRDGENCRRFVIECFGERGERTNL